MVPAGAAVFATLLMNDGYLPGAMVLGHSLKDRGAKAPLVALVLMDKLAASTITELQTVFDEIVPVQQVINPTPANLFVMNRPDLYSTFTKIELWRQTRYKRIVYLDADTVVLRAPNELLTLDTPFAAVPDIGWPDCFNSGCLVLNPNMADYYALSALAQRGISFDGADQGLLNMHFRAWERLSFVYNCTPSGNYQYVPAYRHFSSSIAVVHFIGQDKPWTLGRDNRYNVGVYGELLGMWWSVYDRHYRRQTITAQDAHSLHSAKHVQDYVRGEEPLYVAAEPHAAATSPGAQGQIPLPPTVIVSEDGHVKDATLIELPLGDAPTPVAPADFAPVPTVEQRRFSAPHAEWEPARAPPPVHGKPEAANFPTQIYDMSSDTNLFQPPSRYPDAPKDMWYTVPEKAPEPVAPAHIFPWEARAPKPTRVFPVAKPPTPPPPPAENALEEPGSATSLSGGGGAAEGSEEGTPPPKPPTPDPWAAFQQRTNAWDDMPEIERYVHAFSQSRKGKLQVLHHTPSTPPEGAAASAAPTTPPDTRRRPSMKLTDFPSEVERPSLPVTPAPIRRPSFWGEERDELGNLPTAEGVPKQEDWNPVAKLDELQRRQSQVLVSPTGTREPGDATDLPTRKMPESSSKEAAIEAAMSSMSTSKAPKVPKPILKAPSFELGQSEDPVPGSQGSAPGDDDDDELDPSETPRPSLMSSGSQHVAAVSG